MLCSPATFVRTQLETVSSCSGSYQAVALCNPNGICEWKRLNSLVSEWFFSGWDLFVPTGSTNSSTLKSYRSYLFFCLLLSSDKPFCLKVTQLGCNHQAVFIYLFIIYYFPRPSQLSVQHSNTPEGHSNDSRVYTGQHLWWALLIY